MKNRQFLIEDEVLTFSQLIEKISNEDAFCMIEAMAKDDICYFDGIKIKRIENKKEEEFHPSKYQKAIYKAINESNNHLLVDAKAGSGKTSTLKGIVKLLNPSLKVLNLAFNKSISKEMEEKLPKYIDVKTCHSAGMRIIFTGKQRPKVNDRKYKELAKLFIKQWEFDLEIEEDQDRYRNIIKLCSLARMALAENASDVFLLAEKHGMVFRVEDGEKVLELIQFGSVNHRQIIDFADMIYLPVKYPAWYTIKKYDYVLVDECQDLSRAQQELVKLLVKSNGRMIFVGDERQAIYGFAGADSESFNVLRNIPGIIEMPLNECYRCSPEIIEMAKRIVPAIEAFSGNQKGEVNEKASIEDIKDGDMVLCRNTLPLVMLCYKLIGEGKPAYIKGRDVKKQLIALINKSKIKTITGLKKWMNGYLSQYANKLAKSRPQCEMSEILESSAYVMAEEKVSIINTIANGMNSNKVEALIREINLIFSERAEKGGICLSTIHRSKGLESDRVFIVDRQLMPAKYAKQDWQMEQERNLEYVAYTRAKIFLGFIHDWSSEDISERSQLAVSI